MLLTSCSSQDSEIQVRIAGTAQSIRSQMTGYCWLVFIRTFPLFRGTTRATFLLCPISWVQQVSWRMLFYSVLEALKSSTHIPAFAVPAFVKINDIAVWEGRQNIFWQREHLRCFEDGSDFNREVRNTNSCIRLLMEEFTLVAGPGKLENNWTGSRPNEGGGIRARWWCYVFVQNMTWIPIVQKDGAKRL